MKPEGPEQFFTTTPPLNRATEVLEQLEAARTERNERLTTFFQQANLIDEQTSINSSAKSDGTITWLYFDTQGVYTKVFIEAGVINAQRTETADVADSGMTATVDSIHTQHIKAVEELLLELHNDQKRAA